MYLNLCLCILQLRELRSCELVAMDMGRSMESEATEDVSHFLTVYGSILLIEKIISLEIPFPNKTKMGRV